MEKNRTGLPLPLCTKRGFPGQLGLISRNIWWTSQSRLGLVSGNQSNLSGGISCALVRNFLLDFIIPIYIYTLLYYMTSSKNGWFYY